MEIKKEATGVAAKLKKEGIDFKDLTVAITGGAGFLGSWFCDVLIEQNAKVICIDNFSSGGGKNIEHLKKEKKFTCLKADVSREFKPGRKADIILHFASRASPLEFNKYPVEIWRANTIGTLNVLEEARKTKARVVFASTSEVYGNPAPKFIPTPETYCGYVSSTGVRSCYDEAKRAGEALVMAYVRKYNLDARLARIFNTYGSRMSYGSYGRALPRFIAQAVKGMPLTIFGDGKQTRSFTYVSDEIEGILKLAFLPGLKGDVFNIGNDNETSIIKLAEMVKKITKSDSEIMFLAPAEDDPRRRCPDISKAKRVLKWKPAVKLEEGIKRFAAHIKQELK